MHGGTGGDKGEWGEPLTCADKNEPPEGVNSKTFWTGKYFSYCFNKIQLKFYFQVYI